MVIHIDYILVRFIFNRINVGIRKICDQFFAIKNSSNWIIKYLNYLIVKYKFIHCFSFMTSRYVLVSCMIGKSEGVNKSV